jgi:hypothetical protein
MWHRAFLVFSAAAAFGAGCAQPLGPSPSPTNPNPASAVLLGSWSSMPTPTTDDTCKDFRWVVTQASDDTAAGTFTATCFGDMPVSGSAHGTVIGSTVAWEASAIVMTSDSSSCAISLIGNAQLDHDQIRIAYSGTTCLGDIGGTETLTKD